MFKNDYSVAIEPRILKALVKYSKEENIGYGLDKHSANAKKLILKTFGVKKGDVFFVSGGTQANMLVLSYILKPYEAVLSCDSGHINVHETGSVEGSGHKILTVPNVDGKIDVKACEAIIKKHADEHMVKIKCIYISNSTETGTIYTKDELIALREVCDKYGLLLFVDGARLACALTSPTNDVTPELMGEVCDIFYAGGTKNGTLSGEAIVFKNKSMCEDFRWHIKNKGAMLSKGFVLGVQFETLFKNNLYFELGKKSNDTAAFIKEELVNLNIELMGTSSTNQIFVKCNDPKLSDLLINKYGCELWEDCSKFKIVRIVTSFATTMDDCKELIESIKNI